MGYAAPEPDLPEPTPAVTEGTVEGTESTEPLTATEE